jgi:hypothetical protein
MCQALLMAFLSANPSEVDRRSSSVLATHRDTLVAQLVTADDDNAHRRMFAARPLGHDYKSNRDQGSEGSATREVQRSSRVLATAA